MVEYDNPECILVATGQGKSAAFFLSKDLKERKSGNVVFRRYRRCTGDHE